MKPGSMPYVSVVIPTHDRSEMVVRAVESLYRQEYPGNRMEIIVVLDNCTDDTESNLQALNHRCQFRYLKLDKVGPAVARNKGIEVAVGDVVAFLDDDMECTPEFLRAHANLHAARDNLVVQGYVPLSSSTKRNLHMVMVSRWWELNFDRLAQPGRMLGPQDLCTGNLSVRRKHLLSIGGFDDDFTGYGNEDYELGVRLANQGLEFRFCREALAWHHYDTPLAKSLERTRLEAQADVIYGRKHPNLKRTFRLFVLTQDRSIGQMVTRILAFRLPYLANVLTAMLLRVMEQCERFGLRGTWTRINWALRRYYYWRGIKDSLGSFSALKEYLGDDWIEEPAKKRAKVMSLDLRKEIKAIEGLSGYKAAYILLKDGPRPLSWAWIELGGDWLSPDDLKHAIEQNARQDRVNNGIEGLRPADAVLPPLSWSTKGAKRRLKARDCWAWSATGRFAGQE